MYTLVGEMSHCFYSHVAWVRTVPSLTRSTTTPPWLAPTDPEEEREFEYDLQRFAFRVSPESTSTT